MTPPLYRLDIAPLTPLPLTRSPLFSYRHSERLIPGTLVQIPFGRRSLRGIVYAAEELPGRAPLWLKPIERVIRESWLTANQRALALHISDTYFSSLGNTLKHFVFPLSTKTSLAPVLEAKKKTLRRSSKPRRVKSITYTHDHELWDTLTETLQQQITKKESTLVLVPDLLLLATLESKLAPLFPDELAILSSRLTPKKLEHTWHHIRTGERHIIIGTRQAVFAPFPKLDHILILFPEERLSYKQWDMTPLYETHVVAQELATLFHASLTTLSTAVSLTTPPAKSKKNISLPQQASSPWRIIDQRQDGRGARTRVIAKPIETLLKALPTKSRVLFIAKERGVSGVLTCQKCRLTARCPACHHALAENKAGLLRCLNCQYESSLFPACQHCGHHHFKSFGIGTVKLERELEKQYPEQTLLRIDRDSLDSPIHFREQGKLLLADTPRWIVTTPEIGSLLQLPKQDLVVMLEADHALAFPDFEGEERLFITLQHLRAKLADHGQVIVQTFAPEERLWQYLAQNKTADLLAELAQEREHFGYPPVTAIIKIGMLDLVKRHVTVNLHQVRERFVKVLEKEPTITVTPVFQVSRPFKTKTSHFLIKLPAQTPLPPFLHTLLQRESAHLKIDVHPLHLH